MQYLITNLKTDYRVIGVSETVYEVGEIVTYSSDIGLEIGKIKALTDGDFLHVNILRRASDHDLALFASSKLEDQKCALFLREEIKKNRLEMKVINTIFTIDLRYLLILYEAPRKVDFRGLLKSLLSIFKRVRIEFRQILAKDLAKLLGGIGTCGRVLCCKQLGRSCNSSLKMARNQALASNQNINGICGKPLCCLAYEDEFYTEQRQKLPSLNEYIEFDKAKFRVLKVNLLDETALVEDEDENKTNVDLKQIKYKILK